MDTHHESHFFVLYSAHHKRCGHFIERADFRVVTREDLDAWSRDMTAIGSVQPLPLHCFTCAEELQPTHIRIIEDSDPIAHTIVPEVEISHFKPNDWILRVKQGL